MKMTAKYYMTCEEHPSIPGARRIRALRDIPAHGVRAGDPGGYVTGEINLSHDGDCWIAGDAVSWAGARVVDDALIDGQAQAAGNALVGGTVHVTGQARVYGFADVTAGETIDGDTLIEFGPNPVMCRPPWLYPTGRRRVR